MSGKERAGAGDKRPAPDDVIDVDGPLLIPYVSTFGKHVLELLATFNKNARYVFNTDGTKLQHVLYNGKLLESYAFKACQRIQTFKDIENVYKQNYLLYDIITVYNARELGDEFADAKTEVKKLLKMMEDERPIQKAWRAMQERCSAAEVAKAAAAGEVAEAAAAGGGMSSGGGAAGGASTGKKRKGSQ